MTDTPRTDAQDGHPAIWHGETSDEKFEILYDAMTNHARALERELAEERQRTAFLELNSTKASIKLIDAGITAFGTNEEAIGLLAGKRDEIAAYAEALRNALHELVRLKSIKDWLDVNEPARLAPTRDYFAEGRREEYDRCKEPAWAAARAALAKNPNPSGQYPSEASVLHSSAEASGPVGLGPLSCTCYPDETRPLECQHKYALSECRAAAGLPPLFDTASLPAPVGGVRVQALTMVAEGLRDEFGMAEWGSSEHAEEILRALIDRYGPLLKRALAVPGEGVLREDAEALCAIAAAGATKALREAAVALVREHWNNDAIRNSASFQALRKVAGEPVLGVDLARGPDVGCEVRGTRNPDGSITIESMTYIEARVEGGARP